MSFIPINRPLIGKEEEEAVLEVLRTGMLTDASFEGGKKVREFEGKLRSLLGVKHAIAVASGTAALHASLHALKIKPGDEVIVPSFTFVATANVILACGGKPVFVDTKNDYNIDPSLFRKAITRKTKAVIPVHLYGYPADMDEIREAATKRSVAIIEDAAESLGAEYRGVQTGTMSELGCFSMYATKVATSGEGGAVATNDEELAERLRLIRNHGMVHGYDTRILGYNLRMQEVAAAIASVQMGRLPGFLRARRRNARYLTERTSAMKGVELTQTSADRTHVWYLYTLFLARARNKVMKRLNASGIGAAVYFKMPVHLTPLYRHLGYGKLSLRNSEGASKHVLSLPVHPGIDEEGMERVADEFEKAVKSTK